MKPRDVRKYLFDMKAAGELVGSFTKGKTLEDYLGDPILRAAVERQFEIIGEALNQATQVEPSFKDRITDAARIIAFRNRLIHGYAAVSDEVVWGVVEASLPRLMTEIAGLLDEE
jgi:uncharacterized protein with HEPN domain